MLKFGLLSYKKQSHLRFSKEKKKKEVLLSVSTGIKNRIGAALG